MCVVVPGFGAEVVVCPAVGAAVGEAAALADLRADADGDGERDEPLAEGGALGPVLWPLDGRVCTLEAVPAALLAVLENSVAMPNAVTTLSSVVRQVIRESRRSPESLPAVRLLCRMAATQPAARLRAHQDRASDSLNRSARLRCRLPLRRIVDYLYCRARNALATGTTVLERAESVRNLLRQAADEAFGDSESEKLLYRVLVAGYLEPVRSHEEAASTLCLSRAAYFRRLKTAVERLAEHMAAPGQPLAGVPGSTQDPQDRLMPNARPA